MSEIEIPETQWRQFCDQFSVQHYGWLVNVSQLDSSSSPGDKTMEQSPVRIFPRSRPLQELREGEQGAQVELMVTVGEGKDQTSLLIEDVTSVYSREIGKTHRGLRIDSGRGVTTLIDFCAPNAAGSFDGHGIAEHQARQAQAVRKDAARSAAPASLRTPHARVGQVMDGRS